MAIKELASQALNALGINGKGPEFISATSGKSSTGNPYSLMYSDGFGYIFGKPMAYLPRTDPNQRVFQKTMLRNNTLINIIPGIPYQDDAMLDKAKEILERYNEKYQSVKVSTSGQARERQLDELTENVRLELSSAKVDLRYAIFKQDISGFMRAWQVMVNRTGTAIFGSKPGFIREVLDSRITESVATRGFKVWVEKGTSISETVENTFVSSILESTQKEVSNLVKQVKFLGKGMGAGTSVNDADVDVTSGNDALQNIGQMGSIASKTAGGAVFDFPQIFDDSNFNRSYEVSFRFTSPYGDDRSVANHVIFPFLFLLTCALPRQDGPSGRQSPFIMQVDAPGFFACPMGVISSFSFRKGGDEMLFNDRGLPLVIEGSLTINDLYSNLSLPLNNGQFATNFGSSAFLANLGGLSLYAALDMSITDSLTNRLKGILGGPQYLYNKLTEETYKAARYLGASTALE